MIRRILFGAASLTIASALAVRALAVPAAQTQPPPLPEPVAEMRHHFTEATRLHEAVIRGDLPAVHAAARGLADMPLPSALPQGTDRFVEVIRASARRAAEAPDLAAAAAATAQVLSQCGACHLTSVRPALPQPTARDLSGVVGHMREHQRSVDEMLQGLVIPSTSQWTRGAERLQADPLSADRLPSDPGLTRDVRQAEAQVHEIGARAAAATDTGARVAAYSELLTACAQCHALHGRVWGPRSTPAAGAGS